MAMKTDVQQIRGEVKTEFQQMRKQINDDTQVMVSAAVDPIKDTIFDLNARLQKVESHGPSSSNQNHNTTIQTQLQSQIEALEQQIKELSIQKRPVAVVGFKNCGGLEDAKIWIQAKCTDFGVSVPSEMWCPRGGFKRIVFTKFADIATRDKFVSKVVSMKPEYEGVQVWSREEQPVEVRACEIFLKGLKKLLVGWGFDQTCIKWDAEGTEKTLKIQDCYYS